MSSPSTLGDAAAEPRSQSVPTGLESAEDAHPAPLGEPSLTHRTARGFAWMTSQAVVAKVVTFAGQLALAYYLDEGDFGLTAIAYMFSIVPVLIQQGGLKEVLVRRFRHFSRWANAAFWMSMTLGLIGGMLMALAAPLAARAYNEPQLLGLLLVIAVLFPLDSLSTVPMAKIQGQMRFRLLAAIALAQALIQTALSIMLAARGFGPYSLLLPRIVVTTFTALVCWWLAAPPVKWRLHVRRWKYLVGDGALVIAANACDLVASFLGYLALSVWCTTDDVGRYYFALNLSLQAMNLLTQNLGGVLFPALSSLQNDPQRMGAAFLRALKLLACFAIPACALQAATADPALRAVYADKWAEAIPILQVLSLGMAVRAVSWPAVALMQAQGRFKARLAVALVSLVSLAIAAILGARLGGDLGVAIAASIQMAIVDPLLLRVALKSTGHGSSDIVSALWPGTVIALICVGAGAVATLVLPPSDHLHWLRFAVVVAVSAALFLPALRLVEPDGWREMVDRTRALARAAHNRR